MPTEPFNIVGSYNHQIVASIDAERTVNMFEYIDPLGVSPRCLIQSSGLVDSGFSFGDEAHGFRQQFLFNGYNYLVVGSTVFRISPLNILEVIGNLPETNSGYVGIDANTFQVIFVDGIEGYIFDTNAETYTKITDSDFPSAPIDVCYLDGFFVVANGGTNEFRLCEFNNGMIWGGSGGQLQQGTITSHPGNIVSCRTLHRRLFLFSEFYTEVWENAGIGTVLPFRRNNSLLIEYGTPCIGSVEVGYDRLYFISQNKDGLGPVVEIAGTEPRAISNRALDVQLALYAKEDALSDCRSYVIRDNGVIFYRMNFTKANHTFVYNASFSDPTKNATEEGSRLWTEEEVLNGDRHPAQTHSYVNGINYVGDYDKPILYIVDPRAFTNNGESIRRMRISRPMATPGAQRRRVDRFQLNLLQGNIDQINFNPIHIPLLTQEGFRILTEDSKPILRESDLMVADPIYPEVFLSWSKDGGQTFGYLNKSPMGAVGQRSYRTIWRKLGVTPRGQSFVVKIEFFNEMPFVILGATWAHDILPE